MCRTRLKMLVLFALLYDCLVCNTSEWEQHYLRIDNHYFTCCKMCMLSVHLQQTHAFMIYLFMTENALPTGCACLPLSSQHGGSVPCP